MRLSVSCTCDGWPPAARRSSSPGIMSHNVMLRSDWHGERHREGRGEGLVTEPERKTERGGEREREGGIIMMMMMMRVMMRGHEPKQRHNDTHTHTKR